LTTTNTTDLASVSRGVGALKRRWVVNQKDAVRFALIENPALDADQVRKGWRAEDNDIRGRR
jgi:hypothetical protein